MCLGVLIPKEKLGREPKYGYKVFEERHGSLYAEFRNYGKRYEYNVWMIADSDTFLYDDYGDQYFSGFHVFTNKKSAYTWKDRHQVVKKVLIDEITSAGFEFYRSEKGHKIVVCNKMKILPDKITR